MRISEKTSCTSAPFMRKGTVGDWKVSLSTADGELRDKNVVAELERNGLHLAYEPDKALRLMSCSSWDRIRFVHATSRGA